MQKLKNKPGSILRIKQFSDSEDDGVNGEMEIIENESNHSEKEENNNSDFELEPELGEEEDVKEVNGKQQKPLKKRKKGIIYISSIPQHMNVAICRELMEQFGEVGRIFLQPDKKGSKF